MPMQLQSSRVLVVDDEKQWRDVCRIALGRAGIDSLEVSSAEEALQEADRQRFNLVLTDIHLGAGLNGIELLRRLREDRPEIPVVVMSSRADVAKAVEAMKLGAADFLERPWPSPEWAVHAILRVLRADRLERENRQLRDAIQDRRGLPDLIGTTPAMLDMRELIERIAPLGTTVLVTGETGVGKELVARMLHGLSPRATQRFLAVNCASFQETLLESSLFGYERGAFTGALRRTKGIFEEADGGTLLLDEIGEMPTGLQAKLLRVLQERLIQRLGSTRDIPVDVRMVASTNRDLEAEVEAGRFREDLYYRLNVLRIEVPPLRERLEDLETLAAQLVRKQSLELDRPIQGISPEGIDILRSHRWPGNVRELENVIERAVALSRGTLLETRDILRSLGRRGSSSTRQAGASLRAAEKQHILEVLRRHGWNITHAAETLEVSRTTLRKKIADYELRSES